MQGILEYQSDESSEDDLGTNKTANIHKGEVTNIGIDKEVESDLFGLKKIRTVKQNRKNDLKPNLDRLKQVESCKLIIGDSNCNERVLETSFGNVEIPTSNFWKDFVPEVAQLEKPQTNHSNYYEKQIQSKFDESKGHNFNKRKSDDNECFKKFCIKAYKSKWNRGQTGLSPEDSQSASNMKQKEICDNKRNIFYVHSKITPYLHSHCENKCPQSVAFTWPAHTSAVNCLKWNRSNYSHLLVTSGMDCQIKVWNPWSSLDKCLISLSHHTKAVRCTDWCLDGRNIFSCSYDRTAKINHVESGKEQACFKHKSFVTAGQCHPENENLFLTGSSESLFLWDMRTSHSPVRSFLHKNKFGQVQDVLLINHCQELITCNDIVTKESSDRTVMAWDVRSGVVLSNQVYQERYTCTRLKLHPSGAQFMAQTNGDYVAIFSTRRPYKMESSKRFEGHKVQGYNIGFDLSADGSLLYSGSSEGGIYCYNYRTSRLIRSISKGNAVITDVCAHPVLPTAVAASTWGGSLLLLQ